MTNEMGEMGWDNIPEDSASIANWVFKKLWVKTRDDYVITPSEVKRSATFIYQVWKSRRCFTCKHTMK